MRWAIFLVSDWLGSGVYFTWPFYDWIVFSGLSQKDVFMSMKSDQNFVSNVWYTQPIEPLYLSYSKFLILNFFQWPL